MSHRAKVTGLYKRILRLHKALPPELQVIGTSYARDEFKRHKDVPETEAATFIDAWTEYCTVLYKQVKRNLPPGQDLSNLDDLSHEQLHQLYELKNETDKPGVKS